MDASEGARRLQMQIEAGRGLLASDAELSDGELNAWSTPVKELVTRIYGSDSAAVRGLKSARQPVPAGDFNNDRAMAGHRRVTLQNRVRLLETLSGSLLEDARSENKGSEVMVLEDPNKVIVSWSGRTSKRIAQYIYEWLPKVVTGITPWISIEDIAKGKRWFPELMSQLGKSTTCLICVTPENHKAPWVYYEAGVIAAKQNDENVNAVLFGVTTNAIDHTPLAQFQATIGEKEDIWRLVRDLNRAVIGGRLEEAVLLTLYEKHWPGLEAYIAETLAKSAVPTDKAESIQLVSEYGLGEDAKELLREACQDTGGHILHNDALGGGRIITHGRNFLDPYTPRARATWLGAINELADARLVEDQGRGVFALTREGYKAGDAL